MKTLITIFITIILTGCSIQNSSSSEDNTQFYVDYDANNKFKFSYETLCPNGYDKSVSCGSPANGYEINDLMKEGQLIIHFKGDTTLAKCNEWGNGIIEDDESYICLKVYSNEIVGIWGSAGGIYKRDPN